ncbi:MAG: undecaprenyl-diphosphatase UppP [Candidatus Woesearchaeota archaeon]
MISIIEAIILGIVQGLTEWLPISSSGHLVLFQHLFGLEVPIVFDVILHLGSLLVIFFVFWKDIKKLFFGVLKGNKFYLKYFSYLILATIPIGLVGFFLKDIVESAFGDVRIVGYSLLLTALILFLSKYPKNKEKKLTWKSGLMVGLCQALAIFPGVSRSGTTISVGLMQGINREEAARFSFLLFIPAILGATVLEIGDISSISNLPALLIGTLTTIIVGFFSLKWLLKVIKRGNFSYFAWYCLGLGIVILVLM